MEGAVAADRDHEFFRSLSGEWSGPGEIVAGKYKGTKFVCNFTGETPGARVGVTLDGSCRVGIFSQKMQASIEKRGRGYRGKFLDGAKGKGLDVVSGNVDGQRVVLSLVRNKLRGAMLARLASKDAMNVTVSVKVDKKMVPVIGMSLKRVDDRATGSIKR
ncbi:hypothetical protein CSC94_13030 [Zhengella mangrovi]|uniref:Uncharacterized protein n=2 Tax=Zhengella mangrovi TaxID=1982044 RepID=A0A2G1QMM1_9HYPH|nr:hypothetical protein [Zhengella mangrovi]PHP66721.1 hypothetical protein CSC94_13030 [Zhengella mangrovi]